MKTDNLELKNNSEYNGRIFSGLDLSEHKVSDAEFEGCAFKKCTLTKASLGGCRFIDCSFEDCDLSLVKMRKARLRNVGFRDSKLIGINWAELDCAYSMKFEKCLLNYSIFSGLDLRGIQMLECSIHEADFSDCNISNAVFTHTDFLGTRFSNTNLKLADFSKATRYRINPLNNKIGKAKFSLPEAVGLLSGLDIEII
ncbi:pentapeptide repeat-containing protein [Elusimicrobiota bacterium]